MRRHKYPAGYHAKCNHGHCVNCATRRGENRGNRSVRHAVTRATRAAVKAARRGER